MSSFGNQKLLVIKELMIMERRRISINNPTCPLTCLSRLTATYDLLRFSPRQGRDLGFVENLVSRMFRSARHAS